MQPARRYTLVTVAILVLALQLRLGAAVWWQHRLGGADEFAFGDSFSYWNLAQQLAAGDPYEYAGSRVFRAPGYPLLLAGLFWLREDPPLIWARTIGAVFGTVAVGGVMWLGGQLCGRRAAPIAGLLAAVYPGAIGMSVFILSEAPFCPFMLAHLICWISASRAAESKSSLGYSVLGGCAAGLANLIRPSWILFTPAAAAFALLFGRHRCHQLLIAVTMGTATCVTMMPWWVRNYRVTGTFVPTSLEIGASLYDGLNPQATGGSDMQFVEAFRARLAEEVPGRSPDGRAVYEVRLDRALRSAALSWARQHPRRVLELAVDKFFRMWSPWPHAGELQSTTFRWLTAAGYLPLLGAGLWGLFLHRRDGWEYWLCFLPAVYFTGLHVIFVSSIRYRQPAMLPLAALAAGTLVALLWPGEGSGSVLGRHAGNRGSS